MPDPNLTPIQGAWIKFTDSTRLLLTPQSDDRPLDQFLQLRDSVFTLVQGPAFLTDLQSVWPAFTDQPRKEVGDLLLMELEAFPRALEVANATATAESDKKKWFNRLLGRASTVTGSVGDILDNLPPLAKGGIKLFTELLDLFKGSE